MRTWSQRSKFVKEKLEQRLTTNPDDLDAMDLRIADVYFNRIPGSDHDLDFDGSKQDGTGNQTVINETVTLSKKTISQT